MHLHRGTQETETPSPLVCSCGIPTTVFPSLARDAGRYPTCRVGVLPHEAPRRYIGPPFAADDRPASEKLILLPNGDPSSGIPFQAGHWERPPTTVRRASNPNPPGTSAKPQDTTPEPERNL